jgi:serine phosphatase RsbU (regulator of sigma subunit)
VTDRPAGSERRPRAIPWRLIGLVGAGYFAGSTFSFLVLDAPTALAVFFPPAGVTVAALLLTDRRAWPWILGTAAIAEASSDMLHGMTWDAALGFAVTNCTEPLVSALLLSLVPFAGDLSKRNDFGWFLALAVIAGPMVGGFLGATAIAVILDGPWLESFPAFWSGDALGVLAVGGTILAVTRATWHRTDAVRLTLYASATAVVTTFAFLPEDLPIIYLPIPLMLLMAMRYNVAYVAVAGLVMTLTANAVSALGHGPWGQAVRVPTADIATLQLFLAMTILAAWLLAIAIAERERASRRYEREHETALQLQRALMPQVRDRLLGVSVAASYRPADDEHEVGGDWYDVFELPDGKIAIVVGDILGHELKAAVAMGRVHAVLRATTAGGTAGPAAVLEALDEATDTIPGAWCSTVGYAEFDPRLASLRYACAGHLPPLLVEPGNVRFLKGGRSTPLGVTDVPRTEASEHIGPGAVLLWYSDGLLERRTGNLNDGMRSLAAVVGGLSQDAEPQEWCDRVLAALVGDRAEDDVIIICLRLTTTDQHPRSPSSAARPVPSIPSVGSDPLSE